ncbi:hypothetical protein R8Z50_30215 [Longispora sp. K20-0274]|uniref:hypothetical protein n=1 Tax=Longispora sp. K20-0274 TaxID=3088255 RepID=UPI00399ABAF3
MSRRHAGTILIATLLGMTVALVGCGDSRKETSMLTQQQATDEAERLIHDFTAGVAATARLEPAPGNGIEPPCTDQANGTHMVERAYWLRGIDPAGNDTVYQAFLTYLTAHNYKIARDDWASNGGVAAKHPTNDFTVELAKNATGDVWITADSTCVPNAKPTPR